MGKEFTRDTKEKYRKNGYGMKLSRLECSRDVDLSKDCLLYTSRCV